MLKALCRLALALWRLTVCFAVVALHVTRLRRPQPTARWDRLRQRIAAIDAGAVAEIPVVVGRHRLADRARDVDNGVDFTDDELARIAAGEPLPFGDELAAAAVRCEFDSIVSSRKQP